MTFEPQKARADFLLKMYEVYNKEIERHFNLAWQALSIFGASIIAILATANKLAGLPAFAIVSLYLFLVAWAITVVIDASFWYNRNLVVIANIERQFLVRDTANPSVDDAHNIQWYFTSHRPRNAPITYMRALLGVLCVLAIAVVVFYFLLPHMTNHDSFYIAKRNYIPVVVGAICMLWIRLFAVKRNYAYAEFKSQSPGLPVASIPLALPEHDLSGREWSGQRLMKWLSSAEDLMFWIIGIES